MDNIKFNEDSGFKSRTVFGNPQKPKMIQLIIKTGIVKNEKTAGMLLLMFVLGSIVVSAFLFYKTTQPEEIKYNLSPETIEALPDEIKAKIYESQNR